jgi:hypothetical protein
MPSRALEAALGVPLLAPGAQGHGTHQGWGVPLFVSGAQGHGTHPGRGVPLLAPGAKGMELTSAGRRLQGWARTLHDQAAAAIAAADSLRAGTLVPPGLPVPGLSPRLVWREDREQLPGMREIRYAAARP